MKRFGFIVLSFIFFYLIYGIILTQCQLRIIPEALVADHPAGFHDYKGITNVHAHIGTDRDEFNEVVTAAQAADLDFVFITELGIFDKPIPYEGYHDKLLVFIDGEYNYLSSRLLNYDASKVSHLKGPGQSQVIFADLLSQEKRPSEYGILILAHPFRPQYSWTGEYPPGLDGLEIINLNSLWQQGWLKSKASFIWSLLTYPFNSRLAILRLFEEPELELQLWDTLAKKRKVIGIAGTDAESHFRAFGHWDLAMAKYQSLFSIVTNHVLLQSELTGNAASDRKKIGNAIRNGQFYMSLDTLADPKGFNAIIETASGQVYPLGSELSFSPGLTLKVHLPHAPSVPYDVMIYKDGEVWTINSTVETKVTLPGPGVYRIKVRVIPTFPLPDGKKWVPWIYANPFYVR